MRSATRKPQWYISRGLPVPEAVVAHRMEQVMRKGKREQACTALHEQRATAAEQYTEGPDFSLDPVESLAHLDTIRNAPLLDATMGVRHLKRGLRTRQHKLLRKQTWDHWFRGRMLKDNPSDERWRDIDARIEEIIRDVNTEGSEG